MHKYLPKDFLKISSKLKENLDEERFAHSLNVMNESVKLAQTYGANIEDAAIAGLLHDCGRFFKTDVIAEETKKLGISISKMEKANPKLLHSRVGVYIARKVFGIKKKDILNSIASHTYGREKMSLLEKIVYIADHIEKDRLYKEVHMLRKLAYTNIDIAILKSLDITIVHLIKSGRPLFEKTVTTRNFFLWMTNKPKS